jgi:hypothetical protein
MGILTITSLLIITLSVLAIIVVVLACVRPDRHPHD